MLTPPDGFVRSLKDQHDGKLRIRWSMARNEWQIEEKVSRALTPNLHVSDTDDQLIRWRDGYALVCAVRTGDRMPCPRCGTEMKVPVFRFGEATCPVCLDKLGPGAAKVRASYFPLGDMLLEHLRKIDPNRDGYHRMMRDIAMEQELLEKREKELEADRHYGVIDDFHYMMGSPVIGYTGKEKF